jgi:hypothetical protein
MNILEGVLAAVGGVILLVIVSLFAWVALFWKDAP